MPAAQPNMNEVDESLNVVPNEVLPVPPTLAQMNEMLAASWEPTSSEGDPDDDDGDVTEDEHVGFEKLEHSLAHRSGVTNPAALAAYIGREKYGEKEMEAKSEAARK